MEEGQSGSWSQRAREDERAREGREDESAGHGWEKDGIRGGPSYIDFCPRHPR